MKKEIRKMSGFTLFEMLVVISIIAILTATISMSFSAAQKKARDAKRMEDIKAVANAAEQMYLLSGSTYPSSLNSTGWTIGSQVILAGTPVDPKDKSAYYYGILGSGAFCVCTSTGKLENSSNSNSGQNCGSLGNPQGQVYYCLMGQQ